MERPTATFQGILERDSAGYWHFKEGEFEKAPFLSLWTNIHGEILALARRSQVISDERDFRSN